MRYHVVEIEHSKRQVENLRLQIAREQDRPWEKQDFGVLAGLYNRLAMEAKIAETPEDKIDRD